MSQKNKTQFSWSIFAAAMMGTLAVAVVVFGAWFWISHSSEIGDAAFKERIMHIWIMVAIFLAMLGVGLYLLPKKHANWMSPIQKGVVLALLAHIILILFTRITQVTVIIPMAEVVREAPTVNLRSAPELQVMQESRKQNTPLPIPDPIKQPEKIETPKPKTPPPKTPTVETPKTQEQPKPRELEKPKEEVKKSAEELVKTQVKTEVQSPQLAKQNQQNQFKQNENKPKTDQRPKAEMAQTPEAKAQAEMADRKVQAAKAELKQMAPDAQAWQAKPTAAENAVKPSAEIANKQIDAKAGSIEAQRVAAAENAVKAAGVSQAAPNARLAGETSQAAGAARTVEVSQVPAQAGGSSMAAAQSGASRAGEASSAEQNVSTHLEGLPGTPQMQPGLPSTLAGGRRIKGNPEAMPSAGQGGGEKISNQQLANAGSAGTSKGPGEVGTGALGVPAKGVGGSSTAVIEGNAGGRVGQELGSDVQAGTFVGPVVREGPVNVGVPGAIGGGGPVRSTETAVGPGVPGGTGTAAARQQTGGPQSTLPTGAVSGAAPAAQAGAARAGSTISATDTGGRPSLEQSVGESVGVGNSAAPAGGAPVVSTVKGPAGGVTGAEGRPMPGVDRPGALAGPVATGGGPSGSGSTVQDVSGAAVASNVGGAGSMAQAVGSGGRSASGEAGDAVAINTSITMPEFKPAPEALPQPQALGQRKEEVRKQNVEIMGGSATTEAAVAAALNFLARCQEPDGRWTHFTGGPKPGQNKPSDHDMALTGLATLCFLATDATPAKAGPYQETVRKSLAYLAAHQAADGGMRGDGDMYDHGMATLAMVEAAVMTNEDLYRQPAMRAVRFTIAAQNPQTGGWRYRPGDEGDTSIFGWQVMSLYSIKHLGIKVPDATMWGALRWLDSVASRTPQRALTGYTDRIPQPAMSAEAAFCRILLGQKLSDAQQKELGEYLLHFEPGKGRNDLLGRDDFYLWYYTALCLAQLQNETWAAWNHKMQSRLLSLQNKDGDLKGSWDPKDKHSRLGGRVYTTVLGTLTLEVYYRYLPIFARPKGYVAPPPPKESK
ncbi:MAG: hypothetical protein LLG01_02105 [Planctomycetaceae bacterium]|nr:hypothetical protein [Planctomycetaceae bacterium]